MKEITLYKNNQLEKYLDNNLSENITKIILKYLKIMVYYCDIYPESLMALCPMEVVCKIVYPKKHKTINKHYCIKHFLLFQKTQKYCKEELSKIV